MSESSDRDSTHDKAARERLKEKESIRKVGLRNPEYELLGWREWIQLPELTDVPVKAKIDTGARTSALHAFFIEAYEKEGNRFVKFLIHPYQKNFDIQQECHAPIVDRRVVTDSGGHKEERFVIESLFVVGSRRFRAELTLTDRDSMLFRMLLGRNVLRQGYMVNSGKSFILGGSSKRPPKL